MTERSVSSFYEEVNGYWTQSFYSNSAREEVTDVAVVSVGGGFRDIQVPSELSDMTPLIPASNLVNVVSTSIPNVWLATDHLVRTDEFVFKRRMQLLTDLSVVLCLVQPINGFNRSNINRALGWNNKASNKINSGPRASYSFSFRKVLIFI
jgi:hypothetical protein